MIQAFVSYFNGIVNNTFNLMGNMTVSYTGITILAVVLVGIFVDLTFELIER